MIYVASCRTEEVQMTDRRSKVMMEMGEALLTMMMLKMTMMERVTKSDDVSELEKNLAMGRTTEETLRNGSWWKDYCSWNIHHGCKHMLIISRE